MPNWVYNGMTIHGKTADVEAFIKQASKPVPRQKPNPDAIYGTIDGEWVFEECQFSFWNFVAPKKSDWPDYFTTANGSAPEHNWYNWNVSNWGTKWDVKDEEQTPEVAHDEARGTSTASYNFDTAWSPPSEVYEAIAQKYPQLQVSISWEEEQGFGAELESDGAGGLALVKEWDIPSSHADYVERDNEESCTCAWSEHEEDFYDDCPKKQDDSEDDGSLRRLETLES